MAAFGPRSRWGPTMIETDVRRTRAGRIVLAHDPLHGRRGDGLPGLADLVRLAAGRVALDVELKEPGYVADVLAELDPRPPGLIVTSFLPEVVAEAGALDPALDDRPHLPPRRPGRPPRPGRRLRRCDGGRACERTRFGARRRRARERPAAHGLDREQAAPARDVMANPAVTYVVTDVPDIALAIREA